VTYPVATRADHATFCKREHWTEVRNSRGKGVAHHVTYELSLTDGRILRTRISRPTNRSTYGPRLWAHILRDQLDVTADEFWKCLNQRVLPTRGAPTPPGAGLPADLVYQLIHRVGLAESEVAAMTTKQAADRMARFWATER